ncbi:putative sporulation protein YtxC [Caldisalinibacter kiritimatiensis]|uniref:Sporulation protein YtxC n=1 Tax=Caldisalinibacter kiritimatiensis TaxID=1304284 RepID=R1CF34_9FIRM|nr:putative sporulation protein YtxC [Caldisalinibacter kiritimatiensis]EOD00910.1 hypothetical protein L21TH_1018 [Caldisalinibacter kiritimatiensis]
MELLSIGVKEGSEKVKSLLSKEIENFSKEGFYINSELNDVGDIHFLNYKTDNLNLNKCKNIRKIFVHCVANILADVILDIYQQKYLNRYIAENYYYFSKSEKDKVKEKAIEFLNKGESFSTGGMIFKVSRKSKIIKSIVEYLETTDEIIIEGFINFRLRFFIDSIEEAVEKAVEEFLIEKEYNEFIKVLQYFVEIQEPKIELVNILIKGDKDYLLFDKNYRLINNDFFEEIADEIAESDINHDDLLVSSLITIAPNKVVIHFEYNNSYSSNEYEELIKIIKNIFEDKVSICRGCKLCNKNNVNTPQNE